MSFSAWRQNLGLWLPAAVFLLLNVALLAIFGLRFADEAQVARLRLERQSDALASLRDSRERAEVVVERVRSGEEGLDDFYGRRLSTEGESLTRIIAEIKEMSTRAGIPPSALAYRKERLEGQELSRRTINFAVSGSYAQLRQLINLLELSDSFLILEEDSISAADAEGAPMRINLTLSTLFTIERGSPAASQGQARAG